MPSTLSHAQVLDAIVDLSAKVMPVVMERENEIPVESNEDAREQIRQAAIVVMNNSKMSPLELSLFKGVEWPPLFAQTDPSYLRVFISLVRAIYD